MYYVNGGFTLSALQVKKRWVLPIFVSSLLCAFLLLSTLNMGLLAYLSTFNGVLFSSPSISRGATPLLFKLAPSPSPAPLPPPPASKIPRIAYLISGSKGDVDQLWRTLYALYHPRNYYVLHLDLESPAAERQKLAALVGNQSLFTMVGNVYVISKANMVTYRGSTMVANTLHACAILLKKSKEWDWFINLSSSDYPLVTQDDLLFTFSKLPKNLNFMEHTSELGWKEKQRAKPVIIDPGFYKKTKSDIFWMMPERELPDAFQLFTGSAWMVLTREFVEFCIWGWDNLPRTLLMYYANFLSAPEGYFQTVICNTQEFNATVVNHDLHYITWDNPPKQHPHILTLGDITNMISSNSPFARKFKKNDPVLSIIDMLLLRRSKDTVTPGGWCSGMPMCSNVGDDGRLNQGPGSERLARLMDKLVGSGAYKMDQCR
ncbi:hypothetical protein KSP40_PGU009342 [Platanthera guangdongensis]|uniref:Uncharacterized protein n=1 Tax=Platanthera guangdongensis TaxID=2320717 RepID=A0ABR2LGT3_9ASPA